MPRESGPIWWGPGPAQSSPTCVQVYLCDDGKDPAKRKMMASLKAQDGSGAVYVSGRQRAVGEMNGKSANLNNCLRHIYPETHPVPPHEVVCIFDADQVQRARSMSSHRV